MAAPNAFLTNYAQNAGGNSFLSNFLKGQQSTQTTTPQTPGAPLGVTAKAPAPTPTKNTVPSQYLNPATPATNSKPQNNTTSPVGNTNTTAYNGTAPGYSAGTPIYGNYPGLQPATPPQGQQYQFPSGATGDAYGGITTPPPAQATPTYAGTVGALINHASQPSQQYTDAYNQAQQYNAELEKSLGNEANALAQNSLNPIPIGDQQGRAAVLRQQYLSQQQALGSGFQGASTLLGAANTQQGLQQSGLTSAAGLQQPQQNFPFVFNPVTGSFGAPGVNTNGAVGAQIAGAGTPTITYNPATDAATLAKAVMNHQIGYTDAVNALSYGGKNAAASGQLSSAITSQGGNLIALQAQQAATQSNIQTQGTAATNAANAGYSQAIQQRADADAQYTQLTGISSQLTSTLGNWQNSGALTDYNKAINTLASHLSNTDYQAFIVALGNTQAAYQSILGSAGVTPTKADQDAMNALSPNSSASAIVSALNQLSKDAHSLIVEPAYSKVQEYAGQLGL